MTIIGTCPHQSLKEINTSSVIGVMQCFGGGKSVVSIIPRLITQGQLMNLLMKLGTRVLIMELSSNVAGDISNEYRHGEGESGQLQPVIG
jgi:hypothetical protein